LSKYIVTSSVVDANTALVIHRTTEWLERILDQLKLTHELLELCRFCLRDRFREVNDIFQDWCAANDHKLDMTHYYDEQILMNPESHSYCRVLEEIVEIGGSGLERPVKRILTGLFAETGQEIEAGGLFEKSDLAQGRNSLQETFGLSDAEAEFFLFFFVVEKWQPLSDYFIHEIKVNRFIGRRLLARLLGVTSAELRDIFTGKLASLDIMDFSHHISPDLDFEFFFESGGASDPLRSFFIREKRPGLPLDSFHLQQGELDQVRRLLGNSSGSPTHVLLYGPPGTGKSTFARSLARDLGVSAYRIVQGEEGRTARRRAGIEACRNAVSNLPGVIIVDEADEMLNTRFAFFFSGEARDKGWLNDLLEEEGPPMIWIVNEVDRIEQSVRRRFAHSVHFRPLSAGQRARLWDRILRKHKVKRFVDKDRIAALAREYQVSAGAVDMAVMKASETCGGSGPVFLESVRLSLEAHRVLEHDGRRPRMTDRLESGYSLEGLNVQGDLDRVTAELRLFAEHLARGGDRANMNLLLYGPPGTGKTAMARFLARELDRELVERRASDLLGPYVGQTEHAIATAFQEAEDQDALLVIDEADSFLFSRRDAARSWEVSMVNEFLASMETFRGILVCTTNRFQGMDAASVRRFNHKLEFGFLTPDGAGAFYRRMLAPLAGKGDLAKALESIRLADNLAPGDFGIVRDRHMFYHRGSVSHQELAAALVQESRIKKIQQGGRSIGFN
jgi:AAA+ superfamily predicted ATPase